METKSLDKLFLASALNDLLSNQMDSQIGTVSAPIDQCPPRSTRRRVKQNSSLKSMLETVEKQQENPERKQLQKKQQQEQEEEIDVHHKTDSALEKIRVMRRMRHRILRKLATPDDPTLITPITTSVEMQHSTETYKTSIFSFGLQKTMDLAMVRSQTKQLSSTCKDSSRAVAA
jgi:hypothetical protein